MRNNRLITLIIRKKLVFCIMVYYKRMFSEEMMEDITQTPGRICKHTHQCDQNKKKYFIKRGKPRLSCKINTVESKRCAWGGDTMRK